MSQGVLSALEVLRSWVFPHYCAQATEPDLRPVPVLEEIYYQGYSSCY